MVLTATWTLKKKISDQSILTAKKVGERVSKKSPCTYVQNIHVYGHEQKLYNILYTPFPELFSISAHYYYSLISNYTYRTQVVRHTLG